MGMTSDPEAVVAAYEAGVNFFFLTADLHWPLYEGLRKGLEKLLKDNPARRDEVVVGVVSYLNEPLFGALQFHEVIDAVPGLKRVDLMIAGGVSDDAGFYPRVQSLERARMMGHAGATATGATFHQRPFAVIADRYQLLDIAYIRYNTSHPGARNDVFPYLRPDRAHLLFNFKSVLPWVTPQRFKQLGLPDSYWLPERTDYYRFALSRPEIDGILCSPMSPQDVQGIVGALEKPPLTEQEQLYMMWLSAVAKSPVMA
jgi:hypothetical protein